MKTHKLAMLLTLFFVGSTIADEQQSPYFIGLDFNHFISDNDRSLALSPFANVDDGNGVGAFVGYDLSELVDLRLSIKDIDAASEGTGAYDVDGTIYSFDGLFSPFDMPIYLSAGLNRIDFEDNNTALSFGFGYRHQFNEKLSAFAEAKRYVALSDSLNSDVSLSLGIRYDFGKSITPKPVSRKSINNDLDGDGVLNQQDQCPQTPANVPVDNSGCHDSDNDGVFNNADRCPNSPLNAVVNANGCVDSDQDGVLDSKDQCPQSARGSKVNAVGCADDDRDGVNNELDLCPNSQPGDKVSKTGCVTAKESIELSILFENDASDIKAAYHSQLNKVAKYMVKYPDTKITITGHTSKVGNAQYNQILSEKRAESVARMLANTYGVDINRITVEGKGESMLKLSGNTAEAHRLNRRIEASFY